MGGEPTVLDTAPLGLGSRGEHWSVGCRKWAPPRLQELLKPSVCPEGPALGPTEHCAHCSHHRLLWASLPIFSPQSPISGATLPVTSSEFPFLGSVLDPGGTGHLEPTQTGERGHRAPPQPFPVGGSYCGPAIRRLPSPLPDAQDTCCPRGIVFPPGCALSHLSPLPGFCELIREKEGEEGDAAAFPLSAAIHGD